MDLEKAKLREAVKRRKKQIKVPPELRDARHREQMYRGSMAHNMANAGLRRLHPEEFDELVRLAYEEIRKERGPLPGDPETEGTE